MRKSIPLMILALVILPLTGYAHKVVVFAWAEDNQIHVEGSFGSNRMAQNCKIIVEDASGKLIHEGKTDQNGTYAFDIPEKITGGLNIFLEAGEGHKGSWKLAREEIIQSDAQENIDQAHQQKEKMKAAPSLIKIVSGIIVIFLIAAGLKLIKKKKDA